MLQLDFVYSSPDGIHLRFDCLHPATNEAAPLIVFIHGGGWISGERENFREIADVFVEKGYAAALIQYRLAPLNPFPAAVEDVQAFVRYARDNSDVLNILPNRIASFGSSAGGHLAAMLGVTDVVFNGTSSRVNAVVDYSGLTDLRDYKKKHFDISWSFLEQFMAEPYEGNKDLYKSASPVALVDSESAPTLIVHGEADDIVPIAQSQALAAAFTKNNVPYRFISVPGEGHSFSMASWPIIELATLEFLKERL